MFHKTFILEERHIRPRLLIYWPYTNYNQKTKIFWKFGTAERLVINTWPWNRKRWQRQL